MAMLLDRAKAATATTGTGTVTLGAATVPFRSWAAAGAISNVAYSYLIEESTAWELGWGIYSSTGPTLTRNLISSSTGALLNLAGSATIACVANEMDLSPLSAVPQVAGNYINPDSVGFGTAATTATANSINFYPFSRLAKVDAIAIEVATLLAGNVRGAIYTRHPTTGLPHLLIEEGVAQSTATTGIKAITLAAARWIDKPVYIATNFSAAVSCRSGTVNIAQSLGMNVLNSAAPYSRLNAAFTYAAMPADATSLTFTGTNATLMTALRLTA